MALSPFDFINSINFSKEDLFTEPQAKKDYKAFLVNRGLSYFPDTIFHANEMNTKPDIPEDWQFYFLLNSIPKKKRFSKWAKKEADTDDVSLVKEYYGYSAEKAREALTILSESELTMIKEKLYKGGR